MARLTISIGALFLAGFPVAQAMAADLLTTYRMAMERDPVFLGARAKTEAARENLPQARAQLLPNIGLSGSRSRNDTEQTPQGRTPFDYKYTSEAYALQLRQPLFRMQNYYQYSQAEAQVAAAESTLLKEEQDVAIRLSTAYFLVLLAIDRLKAAEFQVTQYRGHVALAEKSFSGGVGTRNDIEDAKARLDSAVAQEIEARNDLLVAERTLSAVVGERVPAASLKVLDPEKVRQVPAEKASLDDWMVRAEATNPEVAAARHGLEAAEQEVSKARAAHLPTVDLVASRSFSSSETNTTVGNEYRTNAVGVQVNIPIFSGGGMSAATRQAIANRDAARYQVDYVRRQLEIEVTRQHGAVTQGKARLRALDQAEQSARQSVIGSEKGLRAGVRNVVDVLNAQQQLYSVQVDLADARHKYALAYLKLRSATGVLSEEDMLLANSWLVR